MLVLIFMVVSNGFIVLQLIDVNLRTKQQETEVLMIVLGKVMGGYMSSKFINSLCNALIWDLMLNFMVGTGATVSFGLIVVRVALPSCV